jgi:hypothetical protein
MGKWATSRLRGSTKLVLNRSRVQCAFWRSIAGAGYIWIYRLLQNKCYIDENRTEQNRTEQRARLVATTGRTAIFRNPHGYPHCAVDSIR